MRLMILSDGHVFKSDGLCWSRDPWLKVAGHLAPFFTSILLCVPLRQGSDTDLAIGLNKDWGGKAIRWRHTFPHETVINYYKLFPLVLMKNLPVLASAVWRSDVILMRLPAMNAFLTTLLARLLGKPLFCLFTGDQKIQILGGGKYRGVWAIPAKIMAIFHDFLNQRIVGKSTVSFFEAKASIERFKGTNRNCRFMFPTTLEDRHVWVRQSTPSQNYRGNLLFVGRLSAEKGINYLLEAVAQLVKEGVKCTLTICGDGPERGSLEDLAKRSHLGDAVNFLGHIRWGEDLTRIYRNSDVLVVPSLSEGVPKVLLEAMANGLAVVATRVGGMPLVINDGENGILVRPGSSEAIAEALRTISQDQLLRNRLVQEGYRYVREHTAEKQAFEMAKIMMSALSAQQLDSSQVSSMHSNR